MALQRGPHNSEKCPFHITPNQPLTAEKSITRCVECVTCGSQHLQSMKADLHQVAYLTILETSPRYDSDYDVGFTGRSSLSRHRYTVENDSNYRLEVSWEYSHKVMNPDGSVNTDDSTFGTTYVNAGGFVHGLGGRGVDLPPGMYYLDTYTSIDILYARKRAGIPRRIKYAKISEVTGLTDIE